MTLLSCIGDLPSFGRTAMSVRGLRSLWRNDKGSALIEGAIIVPFLLVLVLGVFEFSWLFYQQHLISTGINDGARYVARSAKPHDLTIQNDAKKLATTGAIDGDTSRVRGWTTRDVHISYASVNNSVGGNGLTAFRGDAAIQIVTVSTTFAVPSLGFFGSLGLKPPALTVSHQERVIGPGQVSRR
jgi:Flp pilus assembly protein TadG